VKLAWICGIQNPVKAFAMVAIGNLKRCFTHKVAKSPNDPSSATAATKRPD
jgi:hypothetical protein